MGNPIGFVKIWRKIKVDDEIWDTKESYDKRSAFIYLIMEADWSTGILPHRLTERFLAKEWHWHSSKVHRFIQFLKSVNKLVEVEAEIEAEIGAKSKQKLKQLKICNWETYQKERTKTKSKSEPKSEPESEPIRKEDKEVKKKRKRLKDEPNGSKLSTSPEEKKNHTADIKKLEASIGKKFPPKLPYEENNVYDCWVGKFGKTKGIVGLIKLLLRGGQGSNIRDPFTMLKIINLMDEKLDNPVSRFVDMCQKPPGYLP